MRQISKEKKTWIIDAAISLFNKQGAKKTSMDEIAEASGASKVTIYKYFTDKNNLYEQVFEAISGRYIQWLINSDSSGGAIFDRMKTFTELASTFISSGQKALCEELAAINANVRHGHFLLMQKQSDLINKLIREGREQNVINAAAGDDVIFNYIEMGLCYYQYNLDYRHKIQYDSDFQQRFLTFIWSHIFESNKPFSYEELK